MSISAFFSGRLTATQKSEGGLRRNVPILALFFDFPKIRENPPDSTSNYGDSEKDHGLLSVTIMYHRERKPRSCDVLYITDEQFKSSDFAKFVDFPDLGGALVKPD